MDTDGDKAPLTQRMREATHDVHESSDKLVNLKLAMVITSKPLYAEAISLFWPIYCELESLIEKHQHDSRLKVLYPLLPYLRRSELFEKDFVSLLGNEREAELLKGRRVQMEDGKQVFSPPELQSYIDHLRRLSDEEPIMLIPYVYSMYGAIMAGGAVIKRIVKGAFSLKTNEGVEMFGMSFDGSDYKNVKEFRNHMRAKLDEEIKLSQSEQELILKEAPMVFVRNNALVATVKDSKVFLRVWKNFKNYVLIGLTVATGVALATLYRR